MDLVHDSSVLRAEAQPVDTKDRRLLRRLDAGLLHTMRAHNGAGLAAPQVGLSFRACAVGAGVFRTLFNPRIVNRSEALLTSVERCLSLPGDSRHVPRSLWVDVEWTDSKGRGHRTRFTDFAARVVQHEIDHLDGLLIDRFLSSAVTF